MCPLAHTRLTARRTIPRVQTNRVLASLPRQSYRSLLPGLAAVTLGFGDVLYETGERIEDVYFPGESIVSLLTVVDGHNALEVGLVGWEGIVGIPLSLGVGTSPVRALVQGSGGAMRMSAARFRKAFNADPSLQRGVHRYTHALMAQVTQTAACNRFHGVEARLARWLLMTRDRAGTEELHLTQEFLSHMLGVRRVGVTEAASALQREGLIAYNRGSLRILDNVGLSAVACSCYVPLGESVARGRGVVHSAQSSANAAKAPLARRAAAIERAAAPSRRLA
jgi:CRP-like cAMP-binding protein